MRVTKLTMKGLLRFQDAVALDFAGVPPGLIAVVGENGAGKSTLLDGMFAGFYSFLPSRADRKLFDLVSGARDAYIDVEAEFDGRGRYRARTNIDGVSRALDAVLERDNSPQNDGKISSFRSAVAAALPPPATVLASAFSAQNRHGSFVRLDRKGRKDLFAQLLGLEQLEAYATTARSASLTIERRLEALRGVLEHLRPLTTDAEADELGDLGNRLQVDLATMDEARAHTATQVAHLTAEVARLAQRAEALAEADLERRQAADRLAERQRVLEEISRAAAELDVDEARERTAIETRRQQALAAADRALRALPTVEAMAADHDQRLAAIARRLDEQLAARDLKIRNNQELLGRAEAIRAAQRAEADASAAIAAVDQDIAALDAEVRELTQRIDRAEAALRKTAGVPTQLERARADAALIETVPFGARCGEAGCAFVAQAVAAQQQLPVLEQHLADRQTVEGEIAAWRHQVAEARQAREPLTARRLAKQEVLRATAADVALAPRLEVAEARVRELEHEQAELRREADLARAEAAEARELAVEQRQAQVARLEREQVLARTSADEDRDALAARIAARRQEVADRRLAIAEEIDALTATLARVADVRSALDDAVQAQRTAEESLRLAHQQAADAGAALARLEAEIEAFERRRAEFRTRQAQRMRLEDAVRQLETELIEWQALARVFGRDGLPVLEIDAAGPGVSALANDLLQASFGGRFSLELVTQEVKADGKGMKEAFELKVFDAERGGDARDLADLSGGEQVVVEEALKAALATYVNQRNVAPIRTIWRDETTGALDRENAVRYVAMLRRLHQLSGAHHLLFITHNSEAAALADVQLVVADGAARFVYPPFDGATEAA